ncbi:hypothetical protein Y032_0006g3061 [Ancylostoma ceylanicum]|uniref:Uncharacterized protein n=1 Tax=Ancylostoma ceylanicum TaxID=53326 RepID=A0A016VQD2_9BILA|nr:hypothetical protein Y032_0006g3061 [Ancylostoma ceylanicum]
MYRVAEKYGRQEKQYFSTVATITLCLSLLLVHKCMTNQFCKKLPEWSFLALMQTSIFLFRKQRCAAGSPHKISTSLPEFEC